MKIVNLYYPGVYPKGVSQVASVNEDLVEYWTAIGWVIQPDSPPIPTIPKDHKPNNGQRRVRN